MTFKEKIMKMPIWKVTVIALIGISLSIAFIEEMVVAKVFQYMNHTVDQFAEMFKQDSQEMDEDGKAFDKMRDESHVLFEKGWNDMEKMEKDIREKKKDK